MPLPDVALNTYSISTFRPINQDAGGDSNQRAVHADLSALVRTESRFERGEESGVAERILVTRMVFQPTDRTGSTLDFQSGDLVRFPDYRGIMQERTITLVDAVTVLGELDHIVVEAEIT